jgi:hypothetical protein
MRDRLKSCDTWHADVQSRMVVQKSGRTAEGLPKFKSVCLECLRLRIAERRPKAAYSNLLPRLDWAPPEFLTGL